MTVVDLHPEDLLDREARGELSPDELTHLLEHLEACVVCRFEREARALFRGEFEEISRERAPAPRVESSRPPARSQSRMRLTLLVAAALFIASAAAAEWSGLGRTVANAPTTAGSSRGGEVAAKAAPAPQERLVALVAPASASAPPEPAASPPTAAPALTARPRRTPPPVALPAPVEPATSAAEEPPPPPTASSMFAAANDARRKGAYDDALRLYGDLVRDFPQSTEAVTSHTILGRLLLDHGDAAGALARFDAYLATGHATLREEALLGRALALERLERRAEEAAAWQALLAAFPRSIHAARARAQLAALGGR
jgi:TolA-binding protein